MRVREPCKCKVLEYVLTVRIDESDLVRNTLKKLATFEWPESLEVVIVKIPALQLIMCALPYTDVCVQRGIVQLPSKIDFVIVIKYVMVLMWRMSIPNIVKLY